MTEWTANFSTYDGKITDFHITESKHGSLLPVVRSGESITNKSTAWTHEELLQHAKLIAAAPDIYKALKSIVDFWDSKVPDDCVNQQHINARVALAKVEGKE